MSIHTSRTVTPHTRSHSCTSIPVRVSHGHAERIQSQRRERWGSVGQAQQKRRGQLLCRLAEMSKPAWKTLPMLFLSLSLPQPPAVICRQLPPGVQWLGDPSLLPAANIPRSAGWSLSAMRHDECTQGLLSLEDKHVIEPRNNILLSSVKKSFLTAS